MIQDRLWEWVKRMEVVSRLTLSYLIREPTEIAKMHQRDQGVEYNLQRWVKTGKLNKLRIGNRTVYYLPSDKPGIRGNLEHDCLAGLAAAKLFFDLKGSTQGELSRQAPPGLLPDWTLKVALFEANATQESYFYYVEFHSKRNKQRNLLNKLATYTGQLGDNNWVLVICQRPTTISLPSAHFMLTSLSEHLAAGNSWTDPIWHWGGYDGRYSLLSG